jgi:hypothetical protein
MSKRYDPGPEELLLLEGKESFLIVGRAGSTFCLCIETFNEEYCQGVAEDDLVAVSAPEGGSKEAAMMLLELVRRHRLPLMVLPRDHPGSGRLSYVVSVGPEIRLSCTIQRGTHPEQHVLCASNEFSGMVVRSAGGGIELESTPAGIRITCIKRI